MRKLFVSLLFIIALGSISLVAQNINPALMQMAQTELQKRGLDQTAVETRLIQEGINIESIPPTEYPSYQKRVMAILDQMQKEKAQTQSAQDVQQKMTEPANPQGGVNITVKTETPSINPTSAQSSNLPVNTGTMTMPAAMDIPETTPEEAAAEAQQRVIQTDAAKNEPSMAIYGHSLFTDKSLDIFRTTDGSEAPDTYVLGVGDEIRISIFGASQTDIQQRIADDGSIQPAGVAKVFLKGLTLKQARNLLRERLSYSYSFRQDQFAISIVTARTIMVNIFGEVNVTGSFNLSALNSAFNALSAAGGPTGIGTVRNIQWIRGKEKKTIDLYAFMNDPAQQFDFSLQNNDILFVPVLDIIVAVSGAVKRPMQYELKKGEDLRNLIDFAGGLTVSAKRDYVQVSRYVNGEEKLFEYNLQEVLDGKQKVSLLNGDKVNVKRINKPLENFVNIEGAVYYPGQFDLDANKTLSALLRNAQPNFNAKTDLVFVERTRPDQTIEFLTVHYSPNNDFNLQARDRVRILDLQTYRDVANISVNGDVRTPFNRSFAYGDRMTIAQAIEIAGGLQPTAHNIAYIFRKDLFNTKKTTYIRIDLDIQKDYQLQPGDALTIYDQTTYTDQMDVSVAGSVRSPFTRTFSYEDHFSIAQALEIAGGLKPTANNKAYIFRKNWENPDQTSYIPVDLTKDSLFQLQAGDRLNVYDNSTFTDFGNIRISGAVKTPINLTYDSSLNLHDLLMNAGGFNVGAAYNQVQVFRVEISNTSRVKVKNYTLEVDSNYNLVKPLNFQLQPYDHIVVRMTPEFNLGRTVEINGQVRYPGVYVLESKETSLADVIKMAGGLMKDADRYGSELFRTYKNRGNLTVDISKATKNSHSRIHNPILFEGDVININRLENTVKILGEATRMSQYTISPDQAEQRTIVYQGHKPANWYIKEFAGGFVKNADRRSVSVTLPNNQMKSTQSILGIKFYPIVEPGSIVSVKMDSEKIRELTEPKERMDLETTLSKSLSMLMSTLSVILLMQRL